jgi:hypothetical protein
MILLRDYKTTKASGRISALSYLCAYWPAISKTATLTAFQLFVRRFLRAKSNATGNKYPAQNQHNHAGLLDRNLTAS